MLHLQCLARFHDHLAGKALLDKLTGLELCHFKKLAKHRSAKANFTVLLVFGLLLSVFSKPCPSEDWSCYFKIRLLRAVLPHFDFR